MTDEMERGVLGLGLLCVPALLRRSSAILARKAESAHLCARRALNNNYFTGTIPASIGRYAAASRFRGRRARTNATFLRKSLCRVASAAFRTCTISTCPPIV